MGENKDYSKLEISVAKVETEHHIHDFYTEDNRCKICGKTIEELLKD